MSFIFLGIPFRNILSYCVSCSFLFYENRCLAVCCWLCLFEHFAVFYFKDPWLLVSVIVVMKLCCFFCFLFWPWNLQILKMGSMNRVSGCQLTTPPKVVFARSQARSQTCWSLWLVCRWGWFGFPLPSFLPSPPDVMQKYACLCMHSLLLWWNALTLCWQLATALYIYSFTCNCLRD